MESTFQHIYALTTRAIRGRHRLHVVLAILNGALHVPLGGLGAESDPGFAVVEEPPALCAVVSFDEPGTH